MAVASTTMRNPVQNLKPAAARSSEYAVEMKELGSYENYNQLEYLSQYLERIYYST